MAAITQPALEAAVQVFCDQTKGATWQAVAEDGKKQCRVLVNGDPDVFIWLENGNLKSSDESFFWTIADYLKGGPVESPKTPIKSHEAPIIPKTPEKPRVEPVARSSQAPIGFRKAERKKAKLRLGITGPAGSGKTMSALLIAGGLVDGDYSKVGIVDTENGSADLYVHNEASGSKIGEYNVLPLSPPFEAIKYINAIKMAEDGGLEVVILDSITHAWAGEGGFLEKQGKLADKGGNSWSAWRTVTPEHNRFIDAMLQSKIHVIATMRSKTEHVYEGGKVKKLGMAPVAREGMEYEFSLVFDMDQGHNATPTKDRTSMFDGQIFKPSTDTGKRLLSWLEGRA
jgi:hypothetical protein